MAVVKRSSRVPLTPEAYDDRMISLAYSAAEKQFADGTASSQLITHFLKQGSERDRLERERLVHENELLRAKTEAIKNTQRETELYSEAISMFKKYSGVSEIDSDEDEDDYDY